MTKAGKPTPAQSSSSPPPRTAPRLMILALASGAMLWASFYPINWGWLAWFALVPLLGMVRAHVRPLRRDEFPRGFRKLLVLFHVCARPLRRVRFPVSRIRKLLVLVRAYGPLFRLYGAALLCGLVVFVPALQWMRVADDRMYITWLALSLYCALYFAAAIFILRFLNRRTRLPLIFTFPVVWTALEFLRAHCISGFPWYFLAHTQHGVLPLIQISDLTGAYGLSALVAAVNAVAFEFLSRWGRFRHLSEPGSQLESPRMPLRFQLIGVVAGLGAFLIYGVVRMQDENFEEGPEVLLVQPNVPQQIRNDAFVNVAGAAQAVMDRYCDLTQKALNSGVKPELIAWPESSMPDTWYELNPAIDNPRAKAIEADSHADAVRLARDWHTNFLVGVTALEVEGEKKQRRFNSAILLRDSGQLAGRYNKIHRVPFGEYLPFVDTFAWMKMFSPYDFDYSVHPGVTLNRFHLGEFTFGVLICYEDTDPVLARQYALTDSEGPPVDFFVNISNDGWFDGTSQHEQHLATCRFRAVEARRAIARSVNMGISAVIDGSGRIVALPGPTNSESKKMEGFVACRVPIDHRKSYYALFGDWLPWTCWILIAGASLFGWLRPTTFSNPS